MRTYILRLAVAPLALSFLFTLPVSAQDAGAAGLPAARQRAAREGTSPFIRPASKPSTRPVEEIRHVLVVSIDGLRPDLLLLADSPVIHDMMKRGSYSMWARTTPNSITLPSHVSMMTGVTPRRHDVEWNRDFETIEPLYPRVPTLFEAAKRYGYTTAMAAGKSKFSMFDRPGVLDWKYIPKETKCETSDVIGAAEKIIADHKPDVMLVHFPSVDNTGHAIGWASPQQMKAIADADAAVGRLLKALDQAEMTDSTLVIITADHGGAGKNHGPDDPRSRHIPWVVVGPHVRKHLDLTSYAKLEVNTYDTFATACWVLGIPPTVPDMDGVPVKVIMEQGEKELLKNAPAKPLGW